MTILTPHHASKVWFITGASSGFGYALAQAVLDRGDRAIVTARRRTRLEPLEKQHGDTVLAVTTDVTDPMARESALSAGLEKFGRIDVLANVAGQGSLGAAEEFSIAQLRDQMELNFFAAAELTRGVLPHMRANGSGHILNVSSIGGLAAMQGFSAYCAAKFALEGWSEALRNEVEPLGIHVTIVEPGAFRTEFSGSKNMRPAHRIDAYRPVIEPIEELLYGADGQQAGDPVKAASAMIAAVDSGAPPLRLLLGADAVGIWQGKRDALDADNSAWRLVSEDTGYGPGVATSVLHPATHSVPQLDGKISCLDGGRISERTIHLDE